MEGSKTGQKEERSHSPVPGRRQLTPGWCYVEVFLWSLPLRGRKLGLCTPHSTVLRSELLAEEGVAVAPAVSQPRQSSKATRQGLSPAALHPLRASVPCPWRGCPSSDPSGSYPHCLGHWNHLPTDLSELPVCPHTLIHSHTASSNEPLKKHILFYHFSGFPLPSHYSWSLLTGCYKALSYFIT